MNQFLPESVLTRLDSIVQVKKRAREIRDAMLLKPHPSVQWRLYDFVTVETQPGDVCDFGVHIADRFVLAHFEWFTKKHADQTVSAVGRYRFYLKADDPVRGSSFIEEPILQFEFGKDGHFNIGEDHLQFSPAALAYYDERRHIVLMLLTEAVLLDSFEI